MRLFAALLFVATSVSAQPFTTAEPRGGDLLEPARFVLRDGDRTCVVEADGRGSCTRPGRRAWLFHLPVGDGAIREVHFARDGEDLLVACELDDGEGGWAQLVRLDRGARTPRWKFFIGGLNLAVPVRHERSVLVAALTFVARVDVASGWHDWQLDQAYAGGGFEVPELLVSPMQVRVRSRDFTRNQTRDACYNLESGMCERCVD